MKTLQPAVKWSGSKRSQSGQILALIPEKQYGTYYEPFCGGCSVLYRILNDCPQKFSGYVASDINGTLISLFNAIKNTPETVSDKYAELWKGLNSVSGLDEKKKILQLCQRRA